LLKNTEMVSLLLFPLVQAILVAALVLGSALVIIRYYFAMKRSLAVPASSNDRIEEQKILLPLRLQACERIILFLERISPGNVVMRLIQPDLSARQLQALIMKTIREEFEYNLSQQLYISPKAWELVKNAKEETLKTINVAAGRAGDNAPGSELVKNVFEVALDSGQLPVDQAIGEVKKEIQVLF
jgi:hypothetical protein